MTSTTTALEALSASQVIDRALAAQAAERAAAVERLESALTWARLHPCPVGEVPAHEGELDLHGEVTMALAGPGAPLVAEFAPLELAAALGLRPDEGRALVGDALELAYRLPRLWGHVCAGRVPVWRARAIARETRDLGPDAAAYADRLLAATPGRIGQVRAAQLVDEARLYFDPDRAVEDETHRLSHRGVWLHRGRTPATTEVTMTLDSHDALLFDASVSRIAHDLHTLGDTTTLDIRRASAVGVLADPQYALDLMSGRDARPTTAGTADLYLHLTPADLDGSTEIGAGGIEKLGAATTDLLACWLARHTAAGGTIRVRPVLDLRDDRAVDAHDPPASMRELVVLRDAHCVFPGCTRDSRGCDLDHITPYLSRDDGGPPGQTRPANLAPLCRTHHRIKTHTAWDYKRHDDGAYTWLSPTGHQYDVTTTGRRPPASVARPPHRRRF